MLGGQAAALQQRERAKARAGADQIAALESSLETASKKNDADYFERMLAADFVHVGPSGETITRDEMIADVKSGAIKYDILDRGEIKIRLVGDTAIVTERDLMKGMFRNHFFSGRYQVMRIWARENGQWRIITSQATFFVEPREADEDDERAAGSGR